MTPFPLNQVQYEIEKNSILGLVNAYFKKVPQSCKNTYTSIHMFLWYFLLFQGLPFFKFQVWEMSKIILKHPPPPPISNYHAYTHLIWSDTTKVLHKTLNKKTSVNMVCIQAQAWLA